MAPGFMMPTGSKASRTRACRVEAVGTDVSEFHVAALGSASYTSVADCARDLKLLMSVRSIDGVIHLTCPRSGEPVTMP
jgi:hypothetical protein